MISPHLDDAVLACGECIALHPGCTVLTVFAGVPDDGGCSTEWDRLSGFDDAARAVAARRDEDRVALSRLGARPVWLSFADSQYDQPASDRAIAEALVEVVRAHAGGPLLLPLGLFHSDHLQVHRAARLALARVPGVDAIVYEDVPYRGLPGMLQQRLAQLLDAGVRLTPARWPLPDAAPAKRRATEAYASQLRAFGSGGLEDVALPERFWRFEPMGEGDGHG